MFNTQDGTKEGKYLVLRRDGTKPTWTHFVLGARDPIAADAMRDYADHADDACMDPQYVADCRRHAERMQLEREATGKGDPDAPRHRIDSPLTVALMRGDLSLPDLEAALGGVVQAHLSGLTGKVAAATAKLVEVWQGARIGPAPIPPDVARAIALFVKSARETVAMCRDQANGNRRRASPIVDRLEADADRMAAIGVARAIALFVKSARETVAMCRDQANGNRRRASPIVDRLEADADRMAAIGVARAIALFVKSAREAVAMCRDTASGNGRSVSPIVDHLEADADRLAAIGTGGPWAPPDGLPTAEDFHGFVDGMANADKRNALAELLGAAARIVADDDRRAGVVPPSGSVDRLRRAVDAVSERFGMTVAPVADDGPLVAGGKTPADAKRRAGFVEWMRTASQADLERVIGYTALDVGGAMLEAEGVKFVERFPPGPVPTGYREVEVIAPAGTSFGIVTQSNGVLTLATKLPGAAEWSHGVKPVTGENTIGEGGFTRYVVTYDGDLPPGELRAADLEDGIRHALGMMTAIQAAHPEVPEEGWAELRAVSDHLKGTIAGAGVPDGD